MIKSYRVFLLSFLSLAALLGLSSCQNLNGRGTVESVRWDEGMSSQMRRGFQHLLEMPYAMLYGRFSEQHEVAFILAEGGQDRPHHWVGSSGAELWTQHAHIRASRGLGDDFLRVEVIDEGAVSAFLRGYTEVMDPEHASVEWILPAGALQWLEHVGTVVEVTDVPYISFALNGRAWQVKERVQVTGQPGAFERIYWIEPTTRSLLKMRTQYAVDSAPITLEWIRVPDRADQK
ncbi:YjbF family lipoprotein [Sinimarinibacterium sp. NLF-5-8]|uniref:YjbF family lipoprotein n=1 Tax=Sinimarinibacterium sp. NLF-5-8 TaxID=2698684 RepID=UPI00137C1CF5|nr:YjbF family lipoprotein [Sinimarinibacterium sp. NLF-5-8]QHS09377.1 YjbF family lipoprotein [Sinimarinibacterium sp. NLF-5-8]